MRGVIIHGAKDLRIEEVAPRQLGPRDVRVRIEAVATSPSSTDTSPKNDPFDNTRRSSSSITTTTSPSTMR